MACVGPKLLRLTFDLDQWNNARKLYGGCTRICSSAGFPKGTR